MAKNPLFSTYRPGEIPFPSSVFAFFGPRTHARSLLNLRALTVED